MSSNQVYKEDDRWIVNDLGEEGRNIGGWHWEEIKALPYVKKRLPELFCNGENDPLFKDNDLTIWINNIKEVKGEATVTNRKRKIAAFYEFEVKMEYEAKTSDGKSEKGVVHLPDISDENDLDEFAVRVSVKEGDGTAKKAFFDKKRADKTLREKIVVLLTGLKQGAGIKFNYGAAANDAPQKPAAAPVKKPTPSKPASKPAASSTSSSTTTSSGTTSISLKEEFMAPPGHIYDCFVDQKRIQIYTNSRAEVNAHVGGKFSLLNGSIEGTFIELEHGKKIVQKWRFSNWAKDHYSTLTLNFEQQGSKTILHLHQSNVPRSEEEKLKAGWFHQFFVRIKAVFHYGSIGSTPF